MGILINIQALDTNNWEKKILIKYEHIHEWIFTLNIFHSELGSNSLRTY